MAGDIGSLKHGFLERSKGEVLCRSYSDLGSGRFYPQQSRFTWFKNLCDEVIKYLKNDVGDVALKINKMGRSDPRKVIFAAKMGLALALVSLLIFFKEPLSDMSQYSIWAILTVILVFEFSAGMQLDPTPKCFCKYNYSIFDEYFAYEIDVVE